MRPHNFAVEQTAALCERIEPKGNRMKDIKDQKGDRPSFEEVYDCLKRYGPATCVSSRGTKYTIRAEITAGRPTIIGCPRTERNGVRSIMFDFG
jgi:hypothetical protein